MSSRIESYTPLLDDAQQRFDEMQQHSLSPAPLPRILIIGLRRFTNNTSRPWLGAWDWAAMQRCPGLDAVKTPTAWRRLHDAGFRVTHAVDLLPPGDGVDVEAAVNSARYLRGVIDAIGFRAAVLMGGKVHDAFKAADARLQGQHLLELRHGIITIPSPHHAESDWWVVPEKRRQIEDVAAALLGGRCDDCVNGDTVQDGCVPCGVHGAGCGKGLSFCVLCRRRDGEVQQ